jgi:AbrB family looped-hinge helix DNA binding protein
MVTATVTKGSKTMTDKSQKQVRRVKISSQRQMNIPKEFYEALNLKDEALVEFTGKELIIRPADYEIVDFSVDILKDLVERGYSGEDLIHKFTQVKAEIPKALDRMKQEAMNNPSLTDNLDEYLDSLEDSAEDE